MNRSLQLSYLFSLKGVMHLRVEKAVGCDF